MIVKIGNKLVDSINEPIMVVLNSEEKALISKMGQQNKFCCFPEDCCPSDIVEFMRDKIYN